MIKRCIGCGSILQSIDKDKEGYIDKEKIETSNYCERCFRITNYGEYKRVENKKNDYLNIYKDINNTSDLVLFLVDIFNLNDTIDIVNKYINNDVIIVLTKKDVLPKSVKEGKIRKFIKKYNFNKNIIDVCIVSSSTNYNIDLAYELINKHKKSSRVYVAGNTNAGKSTFINKIIKNYSDNINYVTTSIIPSTTLGINEIRINDDLYLLDTPGLIEDDNISEYVSDKMLKKILPKKEIKPRTYQLGEGDSIQSDDLFRLEYVKGNKNSFTIYISNDIIINRINTMSNLRGKELKKHVLNVPAGSDVMVNGLCFIKIVKDAHINLYTIDNVGVYIRNSLI